jgi:hypothetical protein
MNPTDVAQRTYLEQRRATLMARQPAVVRAALTARTHFESLPKARLCPKEVARLERLVLEAEQRHQQLTRAIAVISAEISTD